SSSEFLTVIAANFDGAQRIANVEKLFRLAEQFEKSGHLIRDFVHYVEEFEAIGGREGEGQMDESANVVRLMTIHQAKGLEFPIVIIPDLHREPMRRAAQFKVTVNREPQPLGLSSPAAQVGLDAALEKSIDPSRPFEELFPLLRPVPPERGQTLRRFSVTHLINFQRCARQYYFDRMLRA